VQEGAARPCGCPAQSDRCKSARAAKEVKNLWYDLRLLGGERPPPIEGLTKRVRDLGQKLGDDHDLAMLLAARADNPLPEPADWETLEKAIASRRPRLQRAALRLASKADSQTDSIRRFRRRSLGNVAFLSQEKMSVFRADQALLNRFAARCNTARTSFRKTLAALVLSQSLDLKFSARFRKIFLRRVSRHPLWRGRCRRTALRSCR
jgi:hypothetical protein